LGGHGKQASRQRSRAAIVAVLAASLAFSVAACGDSESSSDANEKAGTYHFKVTSASFPTRQHLGQTTLMRLGIRNNGEETVPALTVNISVAGKEGRGSTLPFGIRDPQPELAQPDRPVWVLAEHYPKLAGTTTPGGAETSNQKTYDFGPLKSGETANLVWKLSAVKSGHYGLLYAIDAGLGDQVKATTRGGVSPGGSFSVQISPARLDKEVTDSGEVIDKKPVKSGK
jgi:hypothetical protein